MDLEGKIVNITADLDEINSSVIDAQDALQLFWLLLSAQIVFFMQAGFAMLEVGLVGHKNAKSILFKNTLDMCVGTVTWWLWGFGLAGPGASCQGCWGGGNNNFGISGGEIAYENGMPFLHSLAFAATTCTIMSGGVAERMKLSSYLACAVFLISIVYPIIIGWGWDSAGFLCANGFVDFAGSCLVHLTGGVAALLGAMILGPRKHRFMPDGKVTKFKENSVLLAVLGALILIFCWISFNASSTLASDGDSMRLSVHAVVNTMLAMTAATGATVLYGAFFNNGVNDIPDTVNGLLGGLVCITCPCAFVTNWAAVVIGLLSCFVTKLSSSAMVKFFKIDDPLDAWTVHGANGIAGTFLLGIFGEPSLMAQHYAAPLHKAGHWGIIYADSSAGLLGIQCLGIVVVVGFTAAAMFAWILLVSCIMSVAGGKSDGTEKTEYADGTGLMPTIRKAMRMPSDVELVGADYTHHGGSAFELTSQQIKMHNEMRSAQDRLDRKKKKADERRSSRGASFMVKGDSSVNPEEEKKEASKRKSSQQQIKGKHVTGEGPPMGATPPETPESRSRENSSDSFRSTVNSNTSIASSASTPTSNPDEDIFEVE